MIKKISVKTFAVVLLLLAGLASATYYLTKQFNQPRFVRYPGFGIDIPVNYPIHGIDVSRYQDVIDWDEVKQMQISNVKIGFSFIKATEGIEQTDARFKKNWKQAKENRISRGAYHFFIPTVSGKAQAVNFIETVQLEKGDLPPVLDVEHINHTSIAQLQIRIADWIQVVENHYKVKPILYCNADFYSRYLAPKFDDYPLWVAHYFVKDKPRVKRNWLFWQHNDSGRVNGVDTPVDFNVFNGDSTEFKKLLIQ